jgi:hypothetical protein
MLQNLSRILIASLAITFILSGGCNGKVGQAVNGIRDLEPEVKKRNDQINELSNPSNSK